MQSLSRLSVWVVYLTSFIALDWLSYHYAVQPLSISLWNPQSALSLFLLLRYGLNKWPALLVAAWLAEVVVRDMPLLPAYALLSSALQTLVYIAIAAMLMRVGRMDLAFRSLRDLVWLTAVAAVGTLVGAMGSVTIDLVAGSIQPDSWSGNVTRLWSADLVGILVLLPLLLLFFADRPGLAKFQQNLERLVQTASIGIVLWIIFGLEFFDAQMFFYPLFLPLIWIATRHGIWGAILAILLTQLGLVLALLWSDQLTATAVDAQHMMLTMAVTGLFLGMAVSERWRMQKVLSLREVELNQALRFAGARR